MSEISSALFRAYDIRGIYEQTLTPQAAFLIGQAFASVVREHQGQTLCVGRDGRLSSPLLERAFIEGAVKTGIRVLSLGVVSTPMTYFAHFQLPTDAAVMITGSHNPPSHNGLKFTLNQKPFFGDELYALYDRIQQKSFVTGEGKKDSCKIDEAYLNYLRQDFATHYSQGRALKIAWDCGNGASGPIVKALTQHLPGEHILLYTEVDGLFPNHHPDPSREENLVDLQKAVIEHQCDLGIAFDGDGDRIGIMDHLGRPLSGDQLTCFLAEEVLEHHPGASVLLDIKSSQCAFDSIQGQGGNPALVRTGHSYIKSKMRELSCPLAGEVSGHMFLADRYFGFDDGLYAALRTIGRLSQRKTSLAVWFDQLPRLYTTPEIWFDCSADKKATVMDHIKARLKEKRVLFIDLDGVRVSNDAGWWILRPSNTQDILVARLEAQTPSALAQMQQEVLDLLNDAGLICQWPESKAA